MKPPTSSTTPLPPGLQNHLYELLVEWLEKDWEDNAWDHNVYLGAEEEFFFGNFKETIRKWLGLSGRKFEDQRDKIQFSFHNFIQDLIRQGKLKYVQEENAGWIRLPKYKGEDFRKNIETTLSMWFGWSAEETEKRKINGTIKLLPDELWKLLQLNAADKK